MRNLAKGSVLLGLAVMAGIILALQPDAEAVTIADRSQFIIRQESVNKKNQTNTQVNEQKDQTRDARVENKETTPVEEEEGVPFKATAYCLKGRTASGAMVRKGIVAADPKVLPLGSTITISAGQYSGTYLVADTGGLVKGKQIDIWVASCSEAIRFGKRSIKVVVPKKEDG
jgi:3D (Asp-Asp-Asp) domain-containing protein